MQRAPKTAGYGSARTPSVALLGFSLLLWGGAIGCTGPIPAPFLGCVDDFQCANGRCVSGLCVPVAATDISQDQSVSDANQADAGADTGPLTCAVDTDCPAETGACLAATCDNGTCGLVPLAAEVTCSTAGVCPAPGHCSGSGACQAEHAPCDDDNPCSADQCLTTGCNHVLFPNATPCQSDALDCTSEQCHDGVCTATMVANWCLVGGVCAKTADTAPNDPCQICSPSASTTAWTLRTAGPCDDGDPCTVDTTCSDAGACVGASVDCDDANKCTGDVCLVSTGCVHLSNTVTCTDANPCTSDGHCADGACAFKATLDCDDANPCTVDSCAAGFGCFHAPQEAPCVADADPCTDDVCLSGACVAVASASVCKVGGTCVPAGGNASGNPCLVCKPQVSTVSWTALHNVACLDGDLCTVFDTCVQGKCVGESTNCQDNNPCTSDACDPKQGCVFEPVSAPCTDGDACTVDDICFSGLCKGLALTALDCTDNNPCTTDTCLPISGCSHKPHNEPCDDGDACTKADFCTAGVCAAGKLVCPCEFNGDCDDGNACTIDTCVVGVGCQNVAKTNDSACSDGDSCTSDDACAIGVCTGSAITCDDKNPCTEDACASDVGCVHKPLQGKGCSDGDACTSGDLCVEGTCMGTPKACDDGLPCTLDGCNKMSGVCQHSDAAEQTPCPSDGISCTLDRCVKGACDHSAIATSFCLIQGACLSGGAMHPAKQCWGCQPKASQSDWAVFPGQPCNDGNACTEKAACQGDGSCKGSATSCDDNNACTLDACNPQAPGGIPCVHTATTGPCSDGSDCTTNDSCAGETCKGTTVACNDGDPCTDDGCQATGGCVFQDTLDGKGCDDDGLPCTSDHCAGGECKHVPSKGWCAISTTCYADGATVAGVPCLACDAAKQPTMWSAVTGAACDDGDPCTGSDTCTSGACAGDKSKACDDNNACTTDSCTALKGCAHVAAPGACDDGDACTTGDVCAGEKCVAGQPVACVTSQQDEANCHVRVCLPTQGGCVAVTSCGAQHACVTGLCLTQAPGMPPGAVALTIPAGLATQPLRPTLAWQESHAGPMGEIPQLWVVAQTAGCSPSLGVYAKIMTVRMAPATLQPDVSVLTTPAATGGPAWCAAHPVLSPHPTTYDALALTWLEGGNENSACPWTSHGGRARVALLGVEGDATAMTVGAPCPAAGLNAPLPWRPAVALHSAQGSIGKTSPGQLSGVMVRPAAVGGSLGWTGDVVAKWGGSTAAKLPVAKLIGWTEAPTKARVTISQWTSGQVVWAPTAFTDGNGATIPALTATRISPVTGLSTTRQVVLTGAPITGVATYDAVEAVYDPGTKRAAVLIAGRATQNGKVQSFLSFSRLHPDQGASSAPGAIAVTQLTAGQGPIQAFRIARLPNSDRFLVLWAAPGSTVLKAIRIDPKDDFTFSVTTIGAVATNFLSHPVAAGVDSSGGLSELVVDPAGTRYSVAYEGVGTLHLLTAALPPSN